MSVVLYQLSKQNGKAGELYTKLMGSWGHRPDRQRVTVKVGEEDLSLLRGLTLPAGTLGSDALQSGWVTTYQHPRKKTLGLVVHSKDKPRKKRRTFRIGKKRVRLVAVKLVPIKQPEEALVATKTKKGSSRKKAVEEDELDELEGLEDLEDLEDLDEEEEPEDEEELDEEEEDEEPAPKRGRAKAKKAPAKKKTTSRKRRPVEEDEDEEDEEDEDEEEAPRKRSSKSKATTSKKGTTTKSKSTAKKGTAKKGNGNLPATRELPKGQLGPADLAEMVGGNCDARYVRVFLRENYERPDGSRWAFSKGDARDIVREIKRARKGD